jgi:hypothetical protein
MTADGRSAILQLINLSFRSVTRVPVKSSDFNNLPQTRRGTEASPLYRGIRVRDEQNVRRKGTFVPPSRAKPYRDT